MCHKTYLLSEPKEVEDLFNLVKSLGEDDISLGTSLACAPLFEVTVVMSTLQLVLSQLLAGTETSHQVVEDVEVLLSPAVTKGTVNEET